MSLVTRAMSDAYYTNMAHNAAFSSLRGADAQINLAKNAGTSDSRALAEMDKKLALKKANDDLTQKIADAMLENNKKEKLRGFDTFA